MAPADRFSAASTTMGAGVAARPHQCGWHIGFGIRWQFSSRPALARPDGGIRVKFRPFRAASPASIPMALIVQKYGGTSVGSAERIKNVARRVAHWHARGHQVVVVVSAMAGETNRLIGLAKEVQAAP